MNKIDKIKRLKNRKRALDNQLLRLVEKIYQNNIALKKLSTKTHKTI